jgi:hypothetical protein
VRKAKYDLDQNEVKPYLQLEKLREGMFWVAGELFGLEFVPATGVPVFHEDVRVWQVKQKATGKHVGLWYFDPFARQHKRSGAWMDAYRAQERFDGEVTTIVSNNANFVQGKPGEPVLVSWDDATTLFHEFGHALHGLASNVSYPSLSGTAVARDYVGSLAAARALAGDAAGARPVRAALPDRPAHPQELADKIEKAKTFNQGFSTVEYLSSALIDMKLHLAGARPIDRRRSRRETLSALGMPAEIVMRHRTPQFNNVFAGGGTRPATTATCGRTAGGRRLRGVHRGQGPVRPRGRQAAHGEGLPGRQHHGSGGGLPGLPRRDASIDALKRSGGSRRRSDPRGPGRPLHRNSALGLERAFVQIERQEVSRCATASSARRICRRRSWPSAPGPSGAARGGGPPTTPSRCAPSTPRSTPA